MRTCKGHNFLWWHNSWFYEFIYFGVGGGGGRLCSFYFTLRVTNKFAQECEDLKKENKYLSNEIHMERIMMRTESELTMRNLRNLNQELQAQVKEVRYSVIKWH